MQLKLDRGLLRIVEFVFLGCSEAAAISNFLALNSKKRDRCTGYVGAMRTTHIHECLNAANEALTLAINATGQERERYNRIANALLDLAESELATLPETRQCRVRM
jgi:hypothetical protein